MTTCADLIRESTRRMLLAHEELIVFGLGATDPKAIFGTLSGLGDEFGSRVFDVPASENALTGIGIGASANGLKVLMIHQRQDFCFLALDQLLNTAAKWNTMFGPGARPLDFTIRAIQGRGWGQGPTHSQTLKSIFAHFPGLRVVIPSLPSNAAKLLEYAIEAKEPVLYLEHRWLHGVSANWRLFDAELRGLDKACVLREGSDLTICSSGLMILELERLCRKLPEAVLKRIEIIDLVTVNPIDYVTISQSVRKTSAILVIDDDTPVCSVGSELIAWVSANHFSELSQAPRLLALPNEPESTSYNQMIDYHIGQIDIVNALEDMLNIDIDKSEIHERNPYDIPGAYFSGPF